MRKKRLKSLSHEACHPRSTPTSGVGLGASQNVNILFFICEKGRYRLKSPSSTQCCAPINRPGGGGGMTIKLTNLTI